MGSAREKKVFQSTYWKIEQPLFYVVALRDYWNLMCPGVSSNLNGISRRKTEDTNISADKWRIYQQNINTEQENNSLTLDIMVIYGIHLYLQKICFCWTSRQKYSWPRKIFPWDIRLFALQVWVVTLDVGIKMPEPWGHSQPWLSLAAPRASHDTGLMSAPGVINLCPRNAAARPFCSLPWPCPAMGPWPSPALTHPHGGSP